MRPIAIDFGKPRRALPAFVRPLFGAAALAAAVLCGQSHAAFRAERDAWELALVEVPAEEAPSADGDPGQDPLVVTLKQVAAIDSARATPWDQLFASIEAVPTDGVALLDLATDADARDVAMSAEARDVAAMQAYVQALGKTPGLGGVHLAAQETVPQDGRAVIRFSVVASWRAMGKRR
jgi:hypothetical protein